MSSHQAIALQTPAAAPAADAEPKTLFSPYRLGDFELSNRLVMAPMTRSRALDGNVPNPLAATYYAQRASAGLIITEATQVSPQGVGYIRTPGIHSAEQVAGWRTITDAVHRAGGKIFAQLWHVGRVSHPDFHDGALPGRSVRARRWRAKPSRRADRTKMVTPRALETGELPGIVAQFRQAAENAKAAGFDGVELHGANGYLLDQFLRDGSNRRTDAYGGSIENRARLPLEVTDAVIGVWGPAAGRLQALALFFRILDVGFQSDRDVLLHRCGIEQARAALSARLRGGGGCHGGARRNQAGDSDSARRVRRRADRQRRLRRPLRPSGRSPAARPISSPSACRFSPIPIFRPATAGTPTSTRRTRPRSMPARRRATSTIRR